MMAASQAATLSAADIARILQKAAIPTPWRIEQVDVNDGRIVWIVRTYAAPRQLSPNVCLAYGDELDIDAALKPIGKRPSYLLAIGSCASVAADDFRDAFGVLNESVLVRAAAAILSVLRTGHAPSVKVTIVDDESRAALPYLDSTKMVFPELKNHAVTLGFAAPQSCGQIITFAFDETASTLEVRHGGDLDFTNSKGQMVAPRCRD